jgi:hypothetical protein
MHKTILDKKEACKKVTLVRAHQRMDDKQLFQKEVVVKKERNLLGIKLFNKGEKLRQSLTPCH